ncbi:hypothetical protein VTK56DRAFT_5122 [Thermocarpiscus australiensis]
MIVTGVFLFEDTEHERTAINPGGALNHSIPVHIYSLSLSSQTRTPKPNPPAFPTKAVPPLLPTTLPLLLLILLLLLARPRPALAHSHLAYLVINGRRYHGFDPRPAGAGEVNRADHVVWATVPTADDGFVAPGRLRHARHRLPRGPASPRVHVQ